MSYNDTRQPKWTHYNIIISDIVAIHQWNVVRNGLALSSGHLSRLAKIWKVSRMTDAAKTLHHSLVWFTNHRGMNAFREYVPSWTLSICSTLLAHVSCIGWPNTGGNLTKVEQPTTMPRHHWDRGQGESWGIVNSGIQWNLASRA